MTAPEDLTVENFGPLLSMVGTWEGHKGMDFSYHNEEQETGQTSYFERVTFSTFGPVDNGNCLLYTSPSPRDGLLSRMPSSA